LTKKKEKQEVTMDWLIGLGILSCGILVGLAIAASVVVIVVCYLATAAMFPKR
jgi:hypothetical protein